MIRVPVSYQGLHMNRLVGYLKIEEEVADLMIEFPDLLTFSVTTSVTKKKKKQLELFNISPIPAEPKEYREKLERIQGD